VDEEAAEGAGGAPELFSPPRDATGVTPQQPTSDSPKKMPTIFDDLQSDTPAPGVYDTAKYKATGTDCPKYTLSGRHFLPDKMVTPSPVDYRADEAALKLRASSPRYSMRVKTEPKTVFSTPGAGAYDTNRSCLDRRASSLSGRHRDLTQNTNPGPGAYDSSNELAVTRRRSPGYSMGQGRANQLQDFTRTGTSTPGAGAYCPEARESASSAYKRSPAFTMSGRHELEKDAGVPGPGAYGDSASEVQSRSTRSPAFTMSGRFKGQHF